MLTVNDFIAKFEEYSNTDLIDIETKLNDYTEEAQEAFYIVINKRGGIESLKENNLVVQSLKQEESRIIKEATIFFQQKIDVDFVKNTTKSELLDQSKVAEIIDDTYLKLNAEKKGNSVSTKTAVLVLIGGVIASVIGGALMGYSSKNGRVLYIVIGAVFCLNLGIISIISKKPFRNSAVIVASLVSTVVSLVLAGWFFGSE
jgi:hypothetical protein